MADPGSVLVIQSHRQPLPAAWYSRCRESVERWAAEHGFCYRWVGDEIFELLEADLRKKLSTQPVVASDLARLHALELGLGEGHGRVVWIDADVLILDRAGLHLPEAGALFGREVWVQTDADCALKVYRKVHNAFMAFTGQDPVLPFYRFAAERILRRHDGPIVPQLVGPKLLSLLHNAIGFEVLETAAMLPPAVSRDLLGGESAVAGSAVATGSTAVKKLALDRFLEASTAAPLAINLCGSAVASGELSDQDMASLVDLLVQDPALLRRRS